MSEVRCKVSAWGNLHLVLADKSCAIQQLPALLHKPSAPAQEEFIFGNSHI
jgi:hypothetical protein